MFTEIVLYVSVNEWLICSSLFNMQLEMRSQDRQLAQTLLGLNKEIQRLRRENGCLLSEPDSGERTEET